MQLLTLELSVKSSDARAWWLDCPAQLDAVDKLRLIIDGQPLDGGHQVHLGHF